MTIKNPYKQGGMFEGATYLIFENAKQLRNNMTEAERILWTHYIVLPSQNSTHTLI